jgi:alcohol dehydrogenase class IV
VQVIRDLNLRCAIPAGISALGVPASALDGMARSAMTVQRLLAQNPRVVTEQDARRIYQQAY